MPALAGVVVAEVLVGREAPERRQAHGLHASKAGRDTLRVVCGAPNVRVGMKAPLRSAQAAGGEISKSSMRGVESEGMLCSARELGLSDDHSGLLELPPTQAWRDVAALG